MVFMKGVVFMKLKLVKRVFQDNKCVGYYVSDGNRTLPVSIDNVVKYVQAGVVPHVGLKIVDGSYVLYGKDGFKIEDIPVVKLESTKKSSANIRIIEVYKDAGKDVGYTLECNGKTTKVSRTKMLEYDKAGKIVRESLRTAKVINREAEIDCSELFKATGIMEKAKQCINVIAFMNTGDKTEIDEIARTVNSFRASSVHWKGTKESFVAEAKKQLAYIDNKTNRSFEAAKVNSINSLSSRAQVEIHKANALGTSGGEQVAVYIGKNVFPLATKLAETKDFNTFVEYYKKAENALIIASKQLRKLESIKAQNNAENVKRNAIANDIIQRMNKNDELYNEKVRIIREPWCLNNRTFLTSTKNLANCLVTEKGNSNNVRLSLKDVTFRETFKDNKRSGFEVRNNNNGKVYYYRQPLNNMNMMAAFVKVAKDENLLNNSIVNIKIKVNDEYKTIPLGVIQ